MNKWTVGGIGLLFFGVLIFFGSQITTYASHNPNQTYDYNLGVGTPQDGIDDSSPDRPGSDFNNDRDPDRPNRDPHTPDAGDECSDRGTNQDNCDVGAGDETPDRGPGLVRDRGVDLTPDCGNGPGDNECGNPVSFDGAGPEDSTPDNDFWGVLGEHPGDNDGDDTPDMFFPLNRPGDNISERDDEGSSHFPGDRPNADRYLGSVGLPTSVGDRVGDRDCAPADLPLGECDRSTVNLIYDDNRDAVGRDGDVNADFALDGSGEDNTPDRDRSNADDPNRPERDGDSNRADGATDRPDAELVKDGNCCVDRVNQDWPNFDGSPDRVAKGADHALGARDGSPDRVGDDRVEAANADWIPDGVSDRTDRDHGYWNHASPARDTYLFGPGDHSYDYNYETSTGPREKADGDRASDRGGVGFAAFGLDAEEGGLDEEDVEDIVEDEGPPHPNTPPISLDSDDSGEGFLGCSMSPSAKADPAGVFSFLLVLLTPIAIVQLRRLIRR
jgi:hypothetical protein